MSEVFALPKLVEPARGANPRKPPFVVLRRERFDKVPRRGQRHHERAMLLVRSIAVGEVVEVEANFNDRKQICSAAQRLCYRIATRKTVEGTLEIYRLK